MHTGQGKAAIAPRLTLITDLNRYPEATLFDTARQALSGGVDAILIREKQLTSARLLALASRLRQMTYDAQARLIIHTQVDIALAVDADGVHLSSADIASVDTVRRWLAAPEKTVSVSCHNAAELRQACDSGADYAMLSPVFATTCHPGATCLGVDQFNALAAAAPLPIVALGGIDSDHSKAIRGRSMAVISALFTATDAARTAQQLLAAAGTGEVKTLILIRHAKSRWNEPGCTDFERSLNHRGLTDAPEMGKRLADRLHAGDLKLDAFLCSAARRATQTATLLVNELGFPAHAVSRRDELYLASPATMLDAICSIPDEIATVALLAHNPGITELAEILSGQNFGNIPTCGVVTIGFSVNRWAEAGTPAELINFDYPKRHEPAGGIP